ncbi:MAG: glycoside hydrolase family 15 protein, partial [Luteitalea sp.]|nr:glycoside hydrolase family 15 protein [Luteitalea sp.]
MCVPRFDSQPLFAGLLDTARGGAFHLAPVDLVEARQFYEADIGVLVTEMRGRSSLTRATDALTLTSGADLTEDVSMARHELLRQVTVLEGTAHIQLDVAPRGAPRAEPAAGGLRIVCPERGDLDLHLAATVPIEGLRSTITLRAGETASFLPRWSHASGRHRPRPPAQLLEETIAAWRRWTTHFHYEGPQQAAVRRSAVTLK